MTRQSFRNRQQGVLLISSLLIVSLFLVYSSTLALRTATQQRVANQLHDRLQAMDAAQGAIEHLSEVLFADINTQMGATGDALNAFTWLDGVDGPMFDSSGKTAEVLLPTTPPGAPGQAWVSRVCVDPADDGPDPALHDCLPDANPLAARNVTINATATIGGVTKQVQATYRVQLAMSDIFKNAYFVNNYGWMTADGGRRILINGDVRANGNLDFQGDLISTGAMARLFVNGDLFASVNDELGVPGDITVTTPSQFSDLAKYHQGKTNAFDAASADPVKWNWWRTRSRPARKLTLPNEPVIGGGSNPKELPAGMGWDGFEANNRVFSRQPMHPMPYMGDMGDGSFYRGLASNHDRVEDSPFHDGKGSRLRYWADHDGNGTFTKKTTIEEVYDPAKGPDQEVDRDGRPGDDDGKPLILVGTADRPIIIDGPVVVPGDVIIKGVVQGRGTIYAGRNVHIVGEVTYLNPTAADPNAPRTAPEWPAVERNSNTDVGRLRRSDTKEPLGRLCGPNNTFQPGNDPCPSPE